MLITHSILAKKYFKPKYQEIISNTAWNQEIIRQKLSSIFNLRNAHEIILLIEKKEFKKIPVKKLVAYFLLSRPSNLATFIPLAFRLISWKKTLTAHPLISFIGPDGAGKSTMVKALQEHLQKVERKPSVVYIGRGKGYMLPIWGLGRRYKEYEKKKNATTPKKNSVKREITYNLAAVIFTLDLALRYLVSVFPKRRTQHIVITDRYCSDIYLMKHVQKGIRSFLFNLFPKPTITFYLYNNPELLRQRRPQESVEGLQRQLALFQELQPKLKAIPIKTDDYNQTKEKVIVEVNRYLLRNWY